MILISNQQLKGNKTRPTYAVGARTPQAVNSSAACTMVTLVMLGLVGSRLIFSLHRVPCSLSSSAGPGVGSAARQNKRTCYPLE